MKLAYRGKLLSLFHKELTLPNGHRCRLEVIKHPGAVLVIPFLSPDKIIFLRQLRPAIDAYIYELPAGTLGRGEAPSACARREIIEETGYSCSRLKKLGEIFPVPGYSTEKISIYEAHGLKPVKHCREKDEIIESFIVTKKQVGRFFKSGKIKDAKTICALSFCGWLK